MGLSGEKGPLGEEIKGKRKRKKKEWGGEAPWALGPMRVAPPLPPWPAPSSPSMWDSPTLLREGS